VAGEHGFADLEAIIDGAPRHLTPAGRVLVEHGHTQSEGVRALLRRAGFRSIQSFSDLSGIERATGGVLGD
jgi:release factor glutamine methyltransferase